MSFIVVRLDFIARLDLSARLVPQTLSDSLAHEWTPCRDETLITWYKRFWEGQCGDLAFQYDQVVTIAAKGEQTSTKNSLYIRRWYEMILTYIIRGRAVPAGLPYCMTSLILTGQPGTGA